MQLVSTKTFIDTYNTMRSNKKHVCVLVAWILCNAPLYEVICILGTFAPRVPPAYWYFKKHSQKISRSMVPPMFRCGHFWQPITWWYNLRKHNNIFAFSMKYDQLELFKRLHSNHISVIWLEYKKRYHSYWMIFSSDHKIFRKPIACFCIISYCNRIGFLFSLYIYYITQQAWTAKLQWIGW